jgi:hypothetical protein
LRLVLARRPASATPLLGPVTERRPAQVQVRVQGSQPREPEAEPQVQEPGPGPQVLQPQEPGPGPQVLQPQEPEQEQEHEPLLQEPEPLLSVRLARTGCLLR